MNVNAETIWTDVLKIRQKAPLIHNITNYVVMNSTANTLLSIGASPVMAHAEEEVEDMVKIAGALVINIGTLSPAWIRAMHKAMLQARLQKIPIIFDPVGAGATRYRTQASQELIAAVPPTIIRGNASEIIALVDVEAKTKGVDSTAFSETALEAASQIGKKYQCVVCVSGAIDYVIQESKVIKVHNGHPLMPRVTGLGCAATALCGAFAAVNPNPYLATAHGMAVMGIAGEIAAEKSTGTGSFHVQFLDALYNLSEEQIVRYLKVD